MYPYKVYTSIFKNFAVLKQGCSDYSADNYSMTAAVLIYVHVMGNMQQVLLVPLCLHPFPTFRILPVDTLI